MASSTSTSTPRRVATVAAVLVAVAALAVSCFVFGREMAEQDGNADGLTDQITAGSPTPTVHARLGPPVEACEDLVGWINQASYEELLSDVINPTAEVSLMRCEMASEADRQAALDGLDPDKLALLVDQAEQKFAEVGDAVQGS